MAIDTVLFNIITGGTTTAGTSYTDNWVSALNTAVVSPVDPGGTAIIGIACDNAGTSGTSPITSVTDDAGNTYTLLVETTKTGGVASDGVTVALYAAPIFYTSTDVTVNFSTSVTSKVMHGKAWRNLSPVAYSTNGVTGNGTTYNSGNTATASMFNGDLVVGMVAVEASSGITADSDTTRGSWGTVTGSIANTGTTSTSIAGKLHYKVVNADGTQTLNGTCPSGDWAVTWALLKEAPATRSVSSNRGQNVIQAVPRAATR